MRVIKVIAILLGTVTLVLSAYSQYDDDDHDYEHHRDDYNDSQESLEEPDDVLDSLNVDHGHIDYYKHHNVRNKDMLKETTRAKYIFTYEVKELMADQKKKKQQSKIKNIKHAKGSIPLKTAKTTETTERIVHYPAYSKAGVADTSVLQIRHENKEHNNNGD